MSIEKKSLIGNIIATRKALVAKPQVSNKTGVTRVGGAKTKLAATRLSATRLSATRIVATRVKV